MSNVLFVETNPIPVKEILCQMGKIEREIRLPLVNISDENLKKLIKVMKKYKLKK